MSYHAIVSSFPIFVPVLGIDGIYKRLGPFIQQVSKCKHCSSRRLYFVSVDIQRCFDTIVQSKVVEIVAKTIREPHYLKIIIFINHYFYFS